jgi:hypothetical protein
MVPDKKVPGLQGAENALYEVAIGLTVDQLREAVTIVQAAVPNDQRRMDGALLGAVVVALATNMATMRFGRK